MKRVNQTYIEAKPVEELKPHPQNPRIGNDTAVGESIEDLGFFGAILYQKSTGYVLAGHTTLRAATQKHGAKYVPAFEVDVDDDTAEAILLRDNLTSDLATYDHEMLAELLKQADEKGTLMETGYSKAELDDMLQELATQANDSSGPAVGPKDSGLTPEQKKDLYDQTSIRQIVLIMDAEQHAKVVGQLADIIEAEGLRTNTEAVLWLLEQHLASEVEPLPDNLRSLLKSELIELAEARHLDSSGTKSDILDRLQASA